jgi:hypothetical protein
MFIEVGVHFLAATAIASRVSVGELPDLPYDDRLRVLAGVIGTQRATQLCDIVEENKRFIEDDEVSIKVD